MKIDSRDGVPLSHVVAHRNINLSYDAVHLSEYRYFHLHGFKQNERISESDAIPSRHVDLKYGRHDLRYGRCSGSTSLLTLHFCH